MAQKVLAITISNDWIKIAEEIYTPQKGIQVFNAVTLATPAGAVDDGNLINMEAVAGTIEAELAKNEMSSRNVIFSMQSSKIANKEVLTPALKEPKLSTFIKTNATEYFPVNIEDYIITYSVLDTIDTDEDGRQNRVMVVAAPTSMVQSYYDLALKLGLNVTSVDYAGNSNLQLTRLQIDERPSIVIQVGSENTVVSILSNNLLRLMRTVPYGKSTVISAIMEKKETENFTEEDAYKLLATQKVIQDNFMQNEYITDSLRYLVNNIARVMDYYTTKNPDELIEHAYIITEGPAIIGLDELFHNELNGVEVTQLTRLVDVDTSASTLNDSNITLYLTNLGASVDPVNFIPESALEAAKKANSGKYFRIMMYVAVAVAIVLVGLPTLTYMGLKMTNDDLDKKIRNLQWVQETVDAYYNAKDQYSDMQNFAALTTNENDELLEFILFLEANMPSDISLGSLSVNNGSVSLSCTGSSKSTCAQFLMILNNQPNITNVYCPSISESIDAEGITTASFSLTCNFTSFKALEETEVEVDEAETVVDESKEEQ